MSDASAAGDFFPVPESVRTETRFTDTVMVRGRPAARLGARRDPGVFSPDRSSPAPAAGEAAGAAVAAPPAGGGGERGRGTVRAGAPRARGVRSPSRERAPAAGAGAAAAPVAPAQAVGGGNGVERAAERVRREGWGAWARSLLPDRYGMVAASALSATVAGVMMWSHHDTDVAMREWADEIAQYNTDSTEFRLNVTEPPTGSNETVLSFITNGTLASLRFASDTFKDRHGRGVFQRLFQPFIGDWSDHDWETVYAALVGGVMGMTAKELQIYKAAMLLRVMPSAYAPYLMTHGSGMRYADTETVKACARQVANSLNSSTEQAKLLEVVNDTSPEKMVQAALHLSNAAMTTVSECIDEALGTGKGTTDYAQSVFGLPGMKKVQNVLYNFARMKGTVTIERPTNAAAATALDTLIDDVTFHLNSAGKYLWAGASSYEAGLSPELDNLQSRTSMYNFLIAGTTAASVAAGFAVAYWYTLRADEYQRLGVGHPRRRGLYAGVAMVGKYLQETTGWSAMGLITRVLGTVAAGTVLVYATSNFSRTSFWFGGQLPTDFWNVPYQVCVKAFETPSWDDWKKVSLYIPNPILVLIGNLVRAHTNPYTQATDISPAGLARIGELTINALCVYAYYTGHGSLPENATDETIHYIASAVWFYVRVFRMDHDNGTKETVLGSITRAVFSAGALLLTHAAGSTSDGTLAATARDAAYIGGTVTVLGIALLRLSRRHVLEQLGTVLSLSQFIYAYKCHMDQAAARNAAADDRQSAGYLNALAAIATSVPGVGSIITGGATVGSMLLSGRANQREFDAQRDRPQQAIVQGVLGAGARALQGMAGAAPATGAAPGPGGRLAGVMAGAQRRLDRQGDAQ